MHRTVLYSSILLMCMFGIQAQAQMEVSPTGVCPDDIYIVQAALNFSWGTTVQLGPGVFNFSCADPSGNAALYIGYPGQYQQFTYHLSGTPGGTIIVGPGSGTASLGLEINWAHTTIEGITFQGFRRAIRLGSPGYGGPKGAAVQNCTFTDDRQGIQALGESDDLHILNNTFNLSPGQSAAVIFGGSNRLLAAGNTIVGPGASVTLTTIDELINLSTVATSGIWQMDTGSTSSYGRISNNKITGVDLGIQSSSNFAVVSENVVSNSLIAIEISNDSYDGVSMVTDNLVAENNVLGNQVGIWLNAGARNIIESNNALGASLVGILFLSLPGGPDSYSNKYFHNTGSVKGMPKNQGGSLIHPPPDN